jgi:hypothetical protein
MSSLGELKKMIEHLEKEVITLQEIGPSQSIKYAVNRAVEKLNTK